MLDPLKKMNDEQAEAYRQSLRDLSSFLPHDGKSLNVSSEDVDRVLRISRALRKMDIRDTEYRAAGNGEGSYSLYGALEVAAKAPRTTEYMQRFAVASEMAAHGYHERALQWLAVSHQDSQQTGRPVERAAMLNTYEETLCAYYRKDEGAALREAISDAGAAHVMGDRERESSACSWVRNRLMHAIDDSTAQELKYSTALFVVQGVLDPPYGQSHIASDLMRSVLEEKQEDMMAKMRGAAQAPSLGTPNFKPVVA